MFLANVLKHLSGRVQEPLSKAEVIEAAEAILGDVEKELDDLEFPLFLAQVNFVELLFSVAGAKDEYSYSAATRALRMYVVVLLKDATFNKPITILNYGNS